MTDHSDGQLYTDPYNRARLLASSAPSTAALGYKHGQLQPAASAWTMKPYEFAVGLRLGVSLCISHTCSCGALVDARVNHGLSCRRSAGIQARHAQVNDTIHRALVRAGVPYTREPSFSCARATNVLMVAQIIIPQESRERGKCLSWGTAIPGTLAQINKQINGDHRIRSASKTIQQGAELGRD